MRRSEDSADPVALADAAYDVIAARDFLDGVIFVGFDWRALARIRARDPGATCWFTTDKLSGDAQAGVSTSSRQRAGRAGFPISPTPRRKMSPMPDARGLKVGAWTVNRRDDMQRLTGLDAICTDRPDLLAELA